jgi:hypothetical protein
MNLGIGSVDDVSLSNTDLFIMFSGKTTSKKRRKEGLLHFSGGGKKNGSSYGNSFSNLSSLLHVLNKNAQIEQNASSKFIFTNYSETGDDEFSGYNDYNVEDEEENSVDFNSLNDDIDDEGFFFFLID